MLADQNLWSSYTFTEFKLQDTMKHTLIWQQMQQLRGETGVYQITLKLCNAAGT